MDYRRPFDFRDKNAPAPWQLGPKLGPFLETPPEPVILNKDILWFARSCYRWGSMGIRGVGFSWPPAFPLTLCLWLILFGLLPKTTILSMLVLAGEQIRSKLRIWRNRNDPKDVVHPAIHWSDKLDAVIDVAAPLVLIGLSFAWDYSREVPGIRAGIIKLFPGQIGAGISLAGTLILPGYALHGITTVEKLVSKLPRREEAPSVCRHWPALVIATILLETMPDRQALFELVDMTGLGIFILCLALHVDPIQRPTDGIVVVRNVDIGLVFWYVEGRGARLVAQAQASQLDPDDVLPAVLPDEEDLLDED